jgi:hypothetical protein
MIKNLLTYRIGFPLKAIFCLGLFIALGTTNVMAQFAITEDFRGSGNPDIIIGGPGGTEGTAYLTSGVNDPLNAGYLRLTNSNTYQKGFAYVNKSFPSTLGVLVDFEYKMWRPTADTFNGADGIGVFLFDATSTFQLGGYGGSLGYAPGGGSGTGLAGGYVGVGLDAYGNYANPTEGRIGGPGERPNAIVLRGITTAAGATTNQYLSGKTITTTDGVNFNYLDIVANTGTRTQNALDYNTTTTTRPTDSQFYRRVQIEITRLDAAGIYYNVLVRWKTSPTGAFVYVTDYTTTDVPPSLLKLGFAASTGGGINYHEIRNLLVTTPGNLRIVKRGDKDILRTDTAANGTITYTIEVTNDTAFEIPAISFTDRITDSYGELIPEGTSGFDITSITTSGFVTAAMPNVTTLTTNEISGNLVLAANTTGYITITGRLYMLPDGGILQNTASAFPPLDEDLNNNTSTVRTPVTSEGVDLVLTKTVTEQCISTTVPTFTVYLSNNGAVGQSFRRLGINGTRVGFSIVVPNGYTYTDTTPGGLAGTAGDAQNSNVTARWSRVQFNNTPSAGFTTYYYIARGTDAGGAAQTLGAGLTYPYPVTYTMQAPTGTTTYTDTSTARMFSDLGYTTSTETVANQANNNVSIDMYVKPVAPTVSSATLYYCVDEDAPELTATKTNSAYTLRWYMTPGGFSSEYPIKPDTSVAGTYTYYVSQVNGDCEGPTASMTVSVGPSTTGTITAPAAVCPGSTATMSGNAISGSGITGVSYSWQRAVEGGTYTTISGATGQNYTSPALTETTYFRRLVTLTANGKTCTGPGNFVRVFVAQAGIIGNSQASCDEFNPDPFTNVVSGTNGTINGVTYTYQWQRSDNGTTGWQDINNQDGETYDTGNRDTTRYFRRLVEYTIGGTTCTAISNVVVAYVGPDNNNSVNQGGIGNAQTICAGDTPATLNSTVLGGAGGTGYFQWQYSTTSATATDFVVIPDASPTSGSYSPGPLTQTTWFRRRKLNGCNNNTTGSTVQITVLNPTPGTIGTTQTICYGFTPTALTGTAGSFGSQYRWEMAEGTSGGSWVAATGTNNTQNYTPGALTTSKRYRRFTTSVSGLTSCESVASNIVTIIVKSQTNAGTITGAQNICNGGTAATITGTAASSEDAITYLWQVSPTSNGTYSTATGTNNGQNYTPTVTGTYRRMTVTTCGSFPSNTVLVTIQATVNAGTIAAPAAATICYNAVPGQITGTGASGGTGGTYSYRWESSANSTGPFVTAAGTSNGQNYTSPALTATTYFRRVVISTVNGNACESVATTPVLITVQGAVGAGSITGPATGCNGSTINIISASGGTGTGSGTITYRWESVAGAAGGTFTTITGQTSENLSVSYTGTTRYQRYTISTLNGVQCVAGPTNVVTVTLQTLPTGGVIAAPVSRVCSGGSTTFTNNTPGGNFTSYQWQSSTTGSPFNWVDIPGATSATYTTFPLTVKTWFQRLAVNSCGSATSGDIPIDVTIIDPGSLGADKTICNNTSPGTVGLGTGTASGSSNSGGVTYIWQSAPGASGGTFTNVGVTTETYAPGNLTGTIRYRRISSNTSNSVTCTASVDILVTVQTVPGAASITAPNPATLCYGGGSVTIGSGGAGTGDGTISYRWEAAPVSTGVYATISGQTGATLTNSPTVSTNYRRYTISTLNGVACESVATNVITINVQGQINAGTIGSDQSICSGATPTALTSGSVATVTSGLSNTNITYRWEFSTDSGATWATAPGTATNTTYSFPGGISANRLYRRVAIATHTTSGRICETPSATIAITVAAPTAGSVAASQTICFGTQPALFTSASGGAGTGPGTVTYQWQSSDNGSTNWNDIGGATSETYQEPSTLTANKYYRRYTKSNTNGTNCQSGFTNVITVTVAGQVNDPGSLTASNQYICSGGSPAQITSQAAGSVPSPGTISYVWQSSTDGGTTWSADISGATAANYTPPGPMTQNTLFRRLIVGTYGTTQCRSSWGPQIAININPIATGGQIGADQTVCSGTAPTQLSNVTSGANTNGGYQWQISTDNITFTNISGANNADYQPGTITQTTYYRRLGRSNNGGNVCTGTAPSNVVTMTVPAIPTPGSIGSNQNICGNSIPALLTSATPGAGGSSYQWQESYDNSFWANLSGATSATYQPAALASSRYYRRLNINNGCPSPASNVVYINVVANPNPGTITPPASVCSGSTPDPITGDTGWFAGGTGSYRWYSSADGVTWTNTGVTTQNYSFSGPVTVTTYFRRALLTTACAGEVFSNTVTITPAATPTAGSIAGNQNICMDTAPALIGPGTVGTGSGTITYRWESSVNGTSGWTIIAGATAASYQPPVIHSARYYRRTTIATSTVSSNTVVCESGPTGTVIVTTKNCIVITNPMIRSRVN